MANSEQCPTKASLESVLSWLRNYKRCYGNLFDGDIFSTSSIQRFDEKDGNTLRKLVVKFHLLFLLNNLPSDLLKTLTRMGFAWEQYGWILKAFQLFKIENGHVNVPVGFVVPPKNPWPEYLFEFPLGVFTAHIQSNQHTCLSIHANLNKLGFHFPQPAPDDKMVTILSAYPLITFESFLSILRIHKRLHGNYIFPRGYKILSKEQHLYPLDALFLSPFCTYVFLYAKIWNTQEQKKQLQDIGYPNTLLEREISHMMVNLTVLQTSLSDAVKTYKEIFGHGSISSSYWIAGNDTRYPVCYRGKPLGMFLCLLYKLCYQENPPSRISLLEKSQIETLHKQSMRNAPIRPIVDGMEKEEKEKEKEMEKARNGWYILQNTAEANSFDRYLPLLTSEQIMIYMSHFLLSGIFFHRADDHHIYPVPLTCSTTVTDTVTATTAESFPTLPSTIPSSAPPIPIVESLFTSNTLWKALQDTVSMYQSIHYHGSIPTRFTIATNDVRYPACFRGQQVGMLLYLLCYLTKEHLVTTSTKDIHISSLNSYQHQHMANRLRIVLKARLKDLFGVWDYRSIRSEQRTDVDAVWQIHSYHILHQKHELIPMNCLVPPKNFFPSKLQGKTFSYFFHRVYSSSQQKDYEMSLKNKGFPWDRYVSLLQKQKLLKEFSTLLPVYQAIHGHRHIPVDYIIPRTSPDDPTRCISQEHILEINPNKSYPMCFVSYRLGAMIHMICHDRNYQDVQNILARHQLSVDSIPSHTSTDTVTIPAAPVAAAPVAAAPVAAAPVAAAPVATAPVAAGTSSTTTTAMSSTNKLRVFSHVIKEPTGGKNKQMHSLQDVFPLIYSLLQYYQHTLIPTPQTLTLAAESVPVTTTMFPATKITIPTSSSTTATATTAAVDVSVGVGAPPEQSQKKEENPRKEEENIVQYRHGTTKVIVLADDVLPTFSSLPDSIHETPSAVSSQPFTAWTSTLTASSQPPPPPPPPQITVLPAQGKSVETREKIGLFSGFVLDVYLELQEEVKPRAVKSSLPVVSTSNTVSQSNNNSNTSSSSNSCQKKPQPSQLSAEKEETANKVKRKYTKRKYPTVSTTAVEDEVEVEAPQQKTHQIVVDGKIYHHQLFLGITPQSPPILSQKKKHHRMVKEEEVVVYDTSWEEEYVKALLLKEKDTEAQQQKKRSEEAEQVTVIESGIMDGGDKAGDRAGMVVEKAEEEEEWCYWKEEVEEDDGRDGWEIVSSTGGASRMQYRYRKVIPTTTTTTSSSSGRGISTSSYTDIMILRHQEAAAVVGSVKVVGRGQEGSVEVQEGEQEQRKMHGEEEEKEVVNDDDDDDDSLVSVFDPNEYIDIVYT